MSICNPGVPKALVISKKLLKNDINIKKAIKV